MTNSLDLLRHEAQRKRVFPLKRSLKSMLTNTKPQYFAATSISSKHSTLSQERVFLNSYIEIRFPGK